MSQWDLNSSPVLAGVGLAVAVQKSPGALVVEKLRLCRARAGKAENDEASGAVRVRPEIKV